MCLLVDSKSKQILSRDEHLIGHKWFRIDKNGVLWPYLAQANESYIPGKVYEAKGDRSEGDVVKADTLFAWLARIGDWMWLNREQYNHSWKGRASCSAGFFHATVPQKHYDLGEVKDFNGRVIIALEVHIWGEVWYENKAPLLYSFQFAGTHMYIPEGQYSLEDLDGTL